jgi:hypothetical protein
MSNRPGAAAILALLAVVIFAAGVLTERVALGDLMAQQ